MMLTDQMLADAAAEVNEAMLAGLPEPEDCSPEFSTRFLRKMKQVHRRGNHPAAYRVMQRAASVVLVLLIGFAAVMAVSPTVRAGVYGWIKETIGFVTSYESQTPPSQSVWNAIYQITGLDEEFMVEEEYHDEGFHFEVYWTNDGGWLHFSYSAKHDAETLYVGHEGCIVEQVSINGNPGDLYVSEDRSDGDVIVWYDQETQIIFFLHGSPDPEELIALAESVERIK